MYLKFICNDDLDYIITCVNFGVDRFKVFVLWVAESGHILNLRSTAITV
jgi:hypothetical protein